MDQKLVYAVNPEKLDLVMHENEFTIYYDSEPLKTLAGNALSHTDSRLLRHVLIKLTLSKEINHTLVNSYNIVCFYLDSLIGNFDLIGSKTAIFVKEDPIFKTLFKSQQKRIFDPVPILDYLENNVPVLNLMFWGVSMLRDAFQDMIAGMGNFRPGEKSGVEESEWVEKLITENYQSLPPEKRAAINMLAIAHGNGLILPVLLVLQKISPSEYSTATLAIQSNRQPNVLPEFSDIVPDFCKILPVSINWNNPEASFRIFYEQAIRILEFVGFFENSRSKISVICELINQGENDRLEFKSTFRWDIRQNKKNPAIEHAALKSMAAFLNSEGGDLLLGVADDGTVLGIETDNFPNDDKFLLHVWALIKSSMGQDVSQYIRTTLENIRGKTVCRVHCLKSQKPVFLRQSGFDEEFYIRIGPSSGSLEISEALKYISGRFS